MGADDDFAFEPSPGLPAPLPPGESVLWQGSPDWRTLARRPFRCREVALWFAAIALLELLWTLGRGEPLTTALPGIVTTLALGAVALGILVALAWATAHVTIYTLTERRLLIRFGIALQITLHLPLGEIVAAGLRLDVDGTGDIPLELREARGVGYAVLWPHVRPWRFRDPEPMLRAVPDAARVAARLGAALASVEVTAPDVARRGAPSATPARQAAPRRVPPAPHAEAS